MKPMIVAFLLAATPLMALDLHTLSPIRETNWVVGGAHGAAAKLGLPRTTLIARMQRLGISGVTSRSQLGQSARRFAQVMEDLSSRLTEGSAVGVGAMEAVAG